MKLIIDIGNTRIKAGLFNKNEMVRHFVFDTQEEFIAHNFFVNHDIHQCIIASVVENITLIFDYLCEHTDPLLFDYKTPVPIKNGYESAHTLGSDRLSAAVGANYLYPNKNVLVIDAGTCIKYNFISEKNEYLGGGISPGLKIRFKAMNEYTSRLPLLEVDENYDMLIGKNSKDSILSGVQLGAIAELDGIIDEYKRLYTNLTVVITGGDFNFFVKRLKNSIFAHQFLILQGLNVILDTVINEE